MYFAILSISLLANSSAAAAVVAPACPLPPDVTDEADDELARVAVVAGITFSLRDDVLLAGAPFRPATPGLPLVLLIACALSASFSWHIMFSRRLMGVDSGPKKSDMVLERVFRNASCRLRADLRVGGCRVDAKADGMEGE